LTALLDDGSGSVHPQLAGFLAALVGQTHPRSAIIWLRNPVVSKLLTDLARGRVPMTNAGIAATAPRRSTGHLRELLEATGALPRTDRHLARSNHGSATSSIGSVTRMCDVWCTDSPPGIICAGYGRYPQTAR